jgi:hypothetical protein
VPARARGKESQERTAASAYKRKTPLVLEALGLLLLCSSSFLPPRKKLDSIDRPPGCLLLEE